MSAYTEQLLTEAQALRENLVASAQMLTEFTHHLRDLIAQLPPEEPDEPTE